MPHRASGRAQRAEMWRQRFAKIVAFVAPLIIGAVVILLMQQVRTTDHLRLEQQAAEEQGNVLRQLLSAHQDIETGARGYVITGDPKFLTPYDSGSRKLLSIWRVLERTTPNGSREGALLRDLRTVSDNKLSQIRGTINLRRNGDQQAAEARVRAGRGKALMDQIRLQIGRLLEIQQATIAKRSANAQAAVSNLRLVTFVLLAALGAVLAVAWFALQNSLRSRDRALMELEDLALRQRAIVENAMDGIITINPSGSIETVNAAAMRMFGYHPEELDRRDVGILMAHQPAIGEAAEGLKDLDLENQPEGAAVEMLARRSDGSEFPVEVAITAAVLNDGLRYISVIRDITERKRVEQLKSDFVATVTHELRTPLTSIGGALGLLKGGGGGALNERAQRLITIAHDNANRLIRLVNDILDIEKIESGKMPFDIREIDLKAAVSASIEANRSYAAKFGAHISLSAPMTPTLVSADRDRLEQVFTNLLSNAAKFSPPEGTVRVTISPNGPFFRVTIADEGPGIPEEFRDQVFAKFAQADYASNRAKGGTGLGLSIVREIVERLGGEVSFETEIDKGTRFHVDLLALKAQKPAAPSRGGKHPSLLVCGNGAGKALSAALRKAGYAVTLASSPAGVHKAASAMQFDGIVVDMGLPEGASVEIIRMLREEGLNAHTPVLAFGGEPGRSELDGAAALILDWLSKPVDVPRLVDSVEAASVINRVEKPRVLHVEDDPGVQQLVTAALEEHCEIVTVDSVAAARAAINTGEFDLAILDIGLRDGLGVELLPELRGDKNLPLPVIIFSAQDADPENAGLVDACLTKTRTPVDELVATVARLVADHRERTSAP